LSTNFDSYVVNRGPALIRFGYLLTGDRHLAEDLVQDVLARVHRRWSRIERMHQPDTYLRKAVLNQYLSWRRRRSSTERAIADPPDRPVAGADHAHLHAERDALWESINALPRQQRAVLVLRFYEDLADEQIAELIGCSPATVRSHVSRALAQLRAMHTGPDALIGGKP